MQQNNNNFDRFSHVRSNTKIEIEGLEFFKNNLEKHFFADISIQHYVTNSESINLIIELDCNFVLLEALHHFEIGNWGNFKSSKFSFSGALNKLQECNNLNIQIEEFSIFLKDTSIIINRIYDQSIPQQLENILTEVNKHHIYITRGLSEIPFEIYVPVFEDDLKENENDLLINIQSANNTKKDYFRFWGLYYYSEDDALVYDLKNQTIIKANLQMLNS